MALFQCSGCDRTCETTTGILDHCRAKRHHPYSCDECDRIFVDGHALNQHCDSLHTYFCTICNCNFKNQDALDQHRAAKHLHECPYCDRTFNSENALQQHYYAKHRTSCHICGKVFSSENALSQHKAAKHGIPFIKDYDSDSDYLCENQTSLNWASDSGSDDNDDPEPYCPGCNCWFDNMSALYLHLAQSARHNWCFTCSRDFNSPTALQNHTTSPLAHQARIYKCLFCHSMFKSPSCIAHHIESGCHNITHHQVTAAVHALKLSPQISIRNRLEGPAYSSITTQSTSYIATEAAFNGTAYECYLCHATFWTLFSLNAHLASAAHDDDQFECPKCGRRVSLISALIQHIESGVCGFAKFKTITNEFEAMVSRFPRLLKA